MLGFNTLYKPTKIMENNMNKLALAGFTLLSTLTTSNPMQRVQAAQTQPLPEETKPKIEVSCDSVKTQGQAATLKIITRDTLNKPYYIFNQQKFPIYKYNDSTYMSFVPTTPDNKPGHYPITVTDSSKTFTDTLDFEIKEGIFFKQMLPSRKLTRRELKPGEPLATPKELEIAKIRDAENALVRKAIHSPSVVNFYVPPPYDKPTTGDMTTEYGAQRDILQQEIDTIQTPQGKKVYITDIKVPYYHNGNDLRGQEIRAILPGKVLVARPLKYSANGWTCVIDHGMGLKSVCLHMGGFNVKEGDTIQKGQLVGKVGNTGHSFGAHLHFGIYLNGVPVDPEQFLKPIKKSPNLVSRLNALQKKADIEAKAKEKSEKLVRNFNTDSLKRVQTKVSSSVKRTTHLVR